MCAITKNRQKSYKNIGDYESIQSVNPLLFIVGETDGYIEQEMEIYT